MKTGRVAERALGRRESLGGVFLAGGAASVAAWLTSRLGYAKTPLGGSAVGVVVFVAVLWGVVVFLIPGRRPSSMPVQWRAIAGSVTGGLLITMIAIGSLWAYLSSIVIDDGLEGLVFLPILGAASAIVALAARSWTGQFRPIVAAVAACVGIAVAATVHAWGRAEGPPVFPVYAGTVLLFFPTALVGVAIGTAGGDVIRTIYRKRYTALQSDR